MVGVAAADAAAGAAASSFFAQPARVAATARAIRLLVIGLNT
jgi:hypothetical protein